MVVCCVQGRGFEMVVRLGLYFGGLAVDYVTGQADTTDRVQYRAAQLRCARYLGHPCTCLWSVHAMAHHVAPQLSKSAG